MTFVPAHLHHKYEHCYDTVYYSLHNIQSTLHCSPEDYQFNDLTVIWSIYIISNAGPNPKSIYSKTTIRMTNTYCMRADY